MSIRGLDRYLTTPPDDDGWCEVCGKSVDECICPECKICGTVGDPDCYGANGKTSHGLQVSKEQADSLREALAFLEAEAKAEQENMEQYAIDSEPANHCDRIDQIKKMNN